MKRIAAHTAGHRVAEQGGTNKCSKKKMKLDPEQKFYECYEKYLMWTVIGKGKT